MSSTHEVAASHEVVEGPTNRSFGLTVGAVLILIGGVRSWWTGEVNGLSVTLVIVGVGLVGAALILPASLGLLNRAWMKLGLLLAMVANPVIMFLVFAVAVVPTAIVRRALGYDSLGMKPRADATTYWRERQSSEFEPEKLRNQF